MHDKIYENLFDLLIFAGGESFHEVLNPNFSVVLDILSDELIEVLANNEALVTDAADDAGYEDYVVLPLLAVFGVEYHLHNLFGDAEKLNAVVNKALLEERGKLFDLVYLPRTTFL